MRSENQAKVERRRFFRIDDEVRLMYRLQDEELLDMAMSQSFPLLAGLESLSKDSGKQLRRVERFYPEVVAYVKTLESKLDLIARSLLLTQEPELMRQDNCTASISASGVAFNAETSFSVGQILELKMVLLSSMILIVNPVKVIYCEPADSGNVQLPYHVAVDFVDMDEPIREQLIRHVFNRQQEQRRRLT